MSEATLRARVERALTMLEELLDDDRAPAWTADALDDLRNGVEDVFEALGGRVVRRTERPDLAKIAAA